MKILGKSLFQPEYQIIKKAFEDKILKEDVFNLFGMRDEVTGKGATPLEV